MKVRFETIMKYLIDMKQLFVLLSAVMLLQAVASGQESGPEIELRASLQGSQIMQGEVMTVTASMVKAQMVLNSPEAARHLKMSAYLKQPDGSGFLKALFDNGLDGDIKAGDGVYSCRFTAAQEGDYLVSVLAEGKGFRRTQELSFKALTSGKAAGAPAGGLPGQGGDVKAKAEVRHDVKIAAETPDQAPQKFPWITFVIINSVVAALLISGFIFIYLRMHRRGAVRVEKTVMEFGKFVRARAEEKMKQLASDEGKEQKGVTADSKVINELRSARLLFLKGMLAEPQKAEEEMSALWEQICKSLDEALKQVLKGKKTALDEIDVLQEKVEEIGSISEELKSAQALADAQAKKIAFLMSFKDVISESQQKFDSLKKKNKDLEKKLFDAAHQAGAGESMKAPLAELQENYKQLELCVATLESENERLVEEVGRWQKELDQIRKQGPGKIGETPVEVLKENEDLKSMVRELEASLKIKEKELADAFQRFESLESEYMVLYQEKEAAQQQPDI